MDQPSSLARRTGCRVEPVVGLVADSPAVPHMPTEAATAHSPRANRRAPQYFVHVMAQVHRVLPGPIRRLIPLTFLGYVLINGSAFILDISILWVTYEHFHLLYPLAVTIGYAAAGLYSLLLNRWLNFQSHGHLTAQGSRYIVGLVSQYVIFILGLSSLLHWMGVNAELARLLSACCEGIYLYVLMRLWVFRGTPEPVDDAASAEPASLDAAA